MSWKRQLATTLFLMFALLSVTVGYAAQASGSIRGTVFRDTNNDGQCGGVNEGPLDGIPIRFVSGNTELLLQSGESGTYGLVAAGLGTWQVTAEPGPEQGVVTSSATQEVFLSEAQPNATEVDFCVGSTRAAPIVLPESGAPAVPTLWIAALLGLGFVFLGAILFMRERTA